MGRPKGPPTATRSIRLPITEWERLERDARDAGTTLNPHVAKLLAAERAEFPASGPPKAAQPPVPAKTPTTPDQRRIIGEPAQTAAGAAVPLAGTFERKPYQKGQKRPR